jgi:predicted Zn-dependent protease
MIRGRLCVLSTPLLGAIIALGRACGQEVQPADPGREPNTVSAQPKSAGPTPARDNQNGHQRRDFGSYDYPRSKVVTSSNTSRRIDVRNGASCKSSLDVAITAFKQGDDASALDHVTEGLALCPGDPVLLEFRGLVLFARGDYLGASEAVHHVLATRPGWDWATVHSVYADVETYTRHLRALEAYAKKHPDDSSARFLQAYHYKVVGHPHAAVRELEIVIRLEYSDPIAVKLLKSLSKPASGSSTKTASVGRY